MNLITVNNTILDRDKVTALWQDEKDVSKITVMFDNGERLIFTGAEAMEIWKQFDGGGWREKE